MKLKKGISLALCLGMMLTLTACGQKGNAVYVQRVGDLMNMGGIAPGDRFAGMVVSENVTEIQKDADRTVEELLVREGDDVKEGDPLFAYDTEELQLALEKQILELQQMEASIENYKRQIKDLEKERGGVDSSEKLQYTIQIQSLQVDLKEAELNIKSKETAVEKSEKILENAEVKAPVSGRIRAINENGTDQNGKTLPYIVIQQAGAYRVKGTLGELQRGGIREGDKMRITSRTDATQTWTGTVTLVDYESPIDDNNNGGMGISMMGGSSNEMTATSKYPFYVELDSTEGLLLGQHIYMELDTGMDAQAGISAAFVAFREDGTPYVWAEKNGKLEMRSVTLGELNEMTYTYPILDGLTEEDFIAFPDPELCKEGAPTTHEYVEPTVGEDNGEAIDGGVIDPDMGEVIDGGMVDAGMGEAADGGMIDADMGEAVDGGMIDAGMGEAADGGMIDAGMGEAADSGMIDAGMDEAADSGMADAGAAETVDSGVTGGELGEPKETLDPTPGKGGTVG